MRKAKMARTFRFEPVLILRFPPLLPWGPQVRFRSLAMVKLLKSIAGDPRVKQLGPGLITGAADDDPGGIATYSQAGAQFGFSMFWTVLFPYPLMVGIQMVSARLGCITGRGLAANVKSVFPRSGLSGIVGVVLIPTPTNI